MKQSGFTLLELIIVIAIISILAGVSVPYYLESQTDARRSALKSNLASFRKVINDFRGDQNRGPYRVSVLNGAITLVNNPKSSDASGSELVGGPIQLIGGNFVRRTTVKYIPILPLLQDPETGATLNWGYGTCSAYFEDSVVNGNFDISTEFAFISASGSYDQLNDTVISSRSSPLGGATTTLDFIGVVCSDTKGIYY